MKDVIFGSNNSWVIFNNIDSIKQLSKFSNITIFTTDAFANPKDIDARLQNWKKNQIIKDFFIYEKFNNKNNLSLIKLIKSNIKFKLKFKKKLKKYFLCILDSNVHVWQRVLTEVSVAKSCKLIGFSSDFLNINIDALEKFYEGTDIIGLVTKLHKLRQFKKDSKKKNMKRYKNFSGIKNSFIDKFDRKILSKIFFGKSFNYRKYDLNTWFDTIPSNFDEIITYVKSSTLFFKKLYPNTKIAQISLPSNHCRCGNNLTKKKLLYLSSDSPPFDKLVHNTRKKSLIKNLEIILNYNQDISQIDFRQHPQENNEIFVDYFNFTKENLNRKVNFNIDKSNLPIKHISCDYKVVCGMLGTGLLEASEGCKNLPVIGLCSMSCDDLGKNCKVKLLNTPINFIDHDFTFDKNIFDKLNNSKEQKYNLDFVSYLKMNYLN